MNKHSKLITFVALCATTSLALMSFYFWFGTAQADGTPPTLSLVPSSGPPLTKTTDSLVANYTSPTGCEGGKCYIVSFSASDGSLGACFGTLYGAYSGTSYSDELNYSLNPLGGGPCGFGLGYVDPSSEITSTQIFVLAAMPAGSPDVTVACNSSHPLSTRTSCEAFLNANNIPFAEATYTVLTRAQSINALISVVESMNLAQGIQNSLDTKLQNASDALTAANAADRADAVNKLQAFISATQAQSGNKLTVDQANQLIAAANRIIAALQ